MGTTILNHTNVKIGDTLYCEELYNGNEPITVVGIFESHIHGRTDFSGGTDPTHGTGLVDWKYEDLITPKQKVQKDLLKLFETTFDKCNKMKSVDEYELELVKLKQNIEYSLRFVPGR